MQNLHNLRLRLFIAMTAIAVSPPFGICSTPVPSYSMRVWEIRDGLPDEVIQSFSQTTDRYLWIGTTTGLLRFDGAQFTSFNQTNTPALAARSVFCLSSTRDGTLWIGTEGGGLVQYYGGVFRAFSSKDGLSNNVVRVVLEDHQSRVWVGTDDGLFLYTAGRFVPVSSSGGELHITVHAVMEDKSGRVWVGGSRLISIREGIVKEYSYPGTSSNAGLKSIIETREGEIMFGGVTGLYRLGANDGFEKIPNVGGTVRTLKQSSNGDLWIGTIGDGLYVRHGGGRSPERFQLKMPSSAILNFYEDNELNLWIGTQAGLVRLTPSSVGVEPLAIASSSDFGSVFRDSDGTLWFCSRYLYRMKHGSLERSVLPGLPEVTIRNLFRASDGALWVGTEGDGVFRLASGRVTHFSTTGGLASDFVRSMMQSQDGSMWIGTDGGASHIESAGIKNYSVGPGNPSVMTMLDEPDGSVWLGSFRGLAHIKQGRPIEDGLTDRLAMRIIWALHRDEDGGIWIGTSEGLFRRKGEVISHLTAATGLASDLIYQILEDTSGNLWLSSPDGVSQYNRRQLDLVADGKQKRVTPLFLTASGDIGSAELFGTIQPAGVVGKDGVLWFPSNKGAVHILPRPDPQVGPLPIVISPLSIDGRPLETSDPARLPASSMRLDVSFIPVLLGPQDRISLSYKLDGLEDTWQDAGLRRSVSYTNLMPGRYRFQVRAVRLSDGVKVAEASLEFTKLAYFYRTWWFYALCAVVLGLLLWQVHRSRINRMRGRFQIVLEERGRVAREMHDTVLQGCTSVSALLDASDSVAADDPDAARELTSYAKKQLQITVSDTRKAIWNLRQFDSPGGTVKTELKRIAEEAEHEFAVRVDLATDGAIPSIPSVTLHEALMVVREAVRNAGLHARASYVCIKTRLAADAVLIEVADNGSGFVVPNDDDLPHHHYGIRGMYERMRSIGGNLSIESKPGTGTTVVVRVNLPSREVQL